MRHYWFIVDRVQRTQTLWCDELVAIVQRQELGHCGAIRLGAVRGSWRAEVCIRAFTEEGRIIRKAMDEMNSRLDEVYVFANIIRH
jgi:hypothetical protein